MTTSSKKYFVAGSVVLALTFCGTVTAAVSDSTSYKYNGKDWPGLCKTVSNSDLPSKKILIIGTKAEPHRHSHWSQLLL
jgi:hypothetical protein